MQLKVCGVRDSKMLQICQDLSVPYIGFNFVPSSKRSIDTTKAQKLSHAFTGKKVGVFQNAETDSIFETASFVDLDIIQLHGQETPAEIETLKKTLSVLKPFQIWKAFSVDENFETKALQYYSKNCDLFLFDGKSPGSGTQIMHKQSLLDALSASEKLNKPYALAGGINPNTAPNLLSEFSHATLLDTASGVETNGLFDQAKLKQLLTTLRDE